MKESHHLLLYHKSAYSLALFEHFVNVYQSLAPVELHETKSMIAVRLMDRNIAWITALGKNFVHVVFAFQQAFPDNLCFQKIAQVPGDANQYNHHLRILFKEDLNEEVLGFMKLALKK